MRRALLCVLTALLVAACDSPDSPAGPGSPNASDAPAARDGSSVQEGTSTVESGAPCVPVPETTAELPASFPSRLPLPPGSVLTAVERVGEADLLSWRVDAPAEQVLDHFRDAAGPAGLAVVRDEDEGRAGRLQLFGAGGTVDVTAAGIRCPSGASSFTLVVSTP